MSLPVYNSSEVCRPVVPLNVVELVSLSPGILGGSNTNGTRRLCIRTMKSTVAIQGA